MAASLAGLVGTGLVSRTSRGVGARRTAYSLVLPAGLEPGIRQVQSTLRPLCNTEGGRPGDTSWHPQPSPGGVACQSHPAPFSVGCGASGAFGRSRSRGQAGSFDASSPFHVGGSPSFETLRVIPLPFGRVQRLRRLGPDSVIPGLLWSIRPSSGRLSTCGHSARTVSSFFSARFFTVGG